MVESSLSGNFVGRGPEVPEVERAGETLPESSMPMQLHHWWILQGGSRLRSACVQMRCRPESHFQGHISVPVPDFRWIPEFRLHILHALQPLTPILHHVGGPQALLRNTEYRGPTRAEQQ